MRRLIFRVNCGDFFVFFERFFSFSVVRQQPGETSGGLIQPSRSGDESVSIGLTTFPPGMKVGVYWDSDVVRSAVISSVSESVQKQAPCGENGVREKMRSSQDGNDGLKDPPPLALSAYRIESELSASMARREAPIAIGTIETNIAHNVYIASIPNPRLAHEPEVGSRVFLSHGETALDGGIIAKVNGNGTYGVLLDRNVYLSAVRSEEIVINEGTAKFRSNEQFLRVLEWVRTSGITRVSDQESAAVILFDRGWRADKLYLLGQANLNCLLHLSKNSRMCLLQKAEWERDHARQRREWSRERLKEKDWTYVLTKYSGVVSACFAAAGVFSLFLWNYLNYMKQQRQHQLKLALEAMRQAVKPAPPGPTTRTKEVDAVSDLLGKLDTAHPRILIVTGRAGSGKSLVMKNAATKLKTPLLTVTIRDPKEDILQATVHSLGVSNIPACGDLLEFIDEVCKMYSASTKTTPIIYYRLSDPKISVSDVYNDAISIACDRCSCHVAVEVRVEALQPEDVRLLRLDFLNIPSFNFADTFDYCGHIVDPLDAALFCEQCGTNTSDLDELTSAVQQKDAVAAEYTMKHILKAMRHVQLLWVQDERVKRLLTLIAEQPFEEGCKDHDKTLRYLYDDIVATAARSSSAGVRSAAAPHKSGRGSRHGWAAPAALKQEGLEDLKNIVFYNVLTNSWMFQKRTYHTAAGWWVTPRTPPTPVPPAYYVVRRQEIEALHARMVELQHTRESRIQELAQKRSVLSKLSEGLTEGLFGTRQKELDQLNNELRLLARQAVREVTMEAAKAFSAITENDRVPSAAELEQLADVPLFEMAERTRARRPSLLTRLIHVVASQLLMLPNEKPSKNRNYDFTVPEEAFTTSLFVTTQEPLSGGPSFAPAPYGESFHLEGVTDKLVWDMCGEGAGGGVVLDPPSFEDAGSATLANTASGASESEIAPESYVDVDVVEDGQTSEATIRLPGRSSMASAPSSKPPTAHRQYSIYTALPTHAVESLWGYYSAYEGYLPRMSTLTAVLNAEAQQRREQAAAEKRSISLRNILGSSTPSDTPPSVFAHVVRSDSDRNTEEAEEPLSEKTEQNKGEVENTESINNASESNKNVAK